MQTTTDFIDLRQVGQFLVITREGDAYEIHTGANDRREALVIGGPLGYRSKDLTFDDHVVRAGERMRLKLGGRTEITDPVETIHNISGMTHLQIEELKPRGTVSVS